MNGFDAFDRDLAKIFDSFDFIDINHVRLFKFRSKAYLRKPSLNRLLAALEASFFMRAGTRGLTLATATRSFT